MCVGAYIQYHKGPPETNRIRGGGDRERRGSREKRSTVGEMPTTLEDRVLGRAGKGPWDLLCGLREVKH